MEGEMVRDDARELLPDELEVDEADEAEEVDDDEMVEEEEVDEVVVVDDEDDLLLECAGERSEEGKRLLE